jgi:hypothetical protein
MAIAFNPLLSNEGTPTAGVIVTASAAFALDALSLIWVTCRATTDPFGGTFSLSGGSRTWVEVGREGDPNRVGVLFRSMGSGFTSAITITGPTDMLNATWSLSEATGVITGNNGADAITDVAVNGGQSNVSQPNVTIGGTPAAGDVTFAALMVEDAQTYTEEGGWTTVHELTGTLETGHGVYYSTGQDQTFTVTGYDTSSRDWGVVGCILKAAASGGGSKRGGSLLLGGVGH